MRKPTLVVVLALVTLSAATEATAAEWIIKDTSIPHERTDVSALLTSPYFMGIGGGVRIGLPIVPSGFLSTLNDSVFLEVGGQFEYVWFGFYQLMTFTFPAVMRWGFYLTDMWTVYAVGGFSVSIPTVAPAGYVQPGFGIVGTGLFGPVFGVGALWNFSERMALRIESSTLGVQAGLTWQL